MTPRVVRAAGVIVVCEGLLAWAVGAVYLFHALSGTNRHVVQGVSGAGGFGYGSAAWFALMGAGLVAGGLALATGRRWGRGIAVVANLLLLGVAWYVYGAGETRYAVVVAAVALVSLGLLFSPSALDWTSRRDAPGDPG